MIQEKNSILKNEEKRKKNIEEKKQVKFKSFIATSFLDTEKLNENVNKNESNNQNQKKLNSNIIEKDIKAINNQLQIKTKIGENTKINEQDENHNKIEKNENQNLEKKIQYKIDNNINYKKTNSINSLKNNTDKLKNKLQSRLKSLQKKYKTENNNILKSEFISQKVRILELNIKQYQTEKRNTENKINLNLKETMNDLINSKSVVHKKKKSKFFLES